MRRWARFIALALVAVLRTASGQPVDYALDKNGYVCELKVSGDPSGMNWLVATDGSQYGPITSRYALGRIQNAPKGLKFRFSVGRDGEDVTVRHEFKNVSGVELDTGRLEIAFPFNDNYPDSATCVDGRCHAHVWAGDEAAYVCALRMSGKGPHLGWMLTEGSVCGYGIRARGKQTGMSNCRGVITLLTEPRRLAPGEKFVLAGRFFAHQGKDDFLCRMRERGGVAVSADRYVGEVGERIRITAKSSEKTQAWEVPLWTPGETNVVLDALGRRTRVELLAVSDYRKLIGRRLDFLLAHQRYENPNDVRDGAFLPYDNETEKPYLDWKSNKPNWDWNEGRERLGMGLALAEQALVGGFLREKALPALEKYARFVRNGLQEPNYKTWGKVENRKWHRLYNYAWVARYYLDLYRLTGKGEYLTHGFKTLKAAFAFGGYGFYWIDVPVESSLSLLREAGRTDDAESLLQDYRKVAETYLKNGIRPPRSEVNYEQSIIVPAANFLAEMHLVTGESRYRQGVERMLAAVEAFNGFQPSWHLNDIAIRHWDGRYFGKRKLLGDTFPHYWSAITADFFANWARACGDGRYLLRAAEICKANLGLLTEEGRGGAAFVYPDLIDGKPARFLDPLANDQDFALMFAARHLETVIRIDGRRQLFVDDHVVARTNGIERIFPRPVKYAGNPVLRPETPEETEAASGGTNAPCAVAVGGGLWWDPVRKVYRLWYEAGWMNRLAYAESDDGIAWRRVKTDVETGTNLLLPETKVDSWSVSPDFSSEDPYANWRMMVSLEGGVTSNLIYEAKDGIHWKRVGFAGMSGDRSTMFYDPFRGGWVFSLRAYRNRQRVRDFKFSRLFREAGRFAKIPWLETDEGDTPDEALAKVQPRPQLYNFDAAPYESLMVGIFEMHYGPDNEDCLKAGLPKITDLQFAYSRDGFTYERPDRTAAIRSERWGSGKWDTGYVQPLSSCFVVTGDEIRIYYSAMRGDPTRNKMPKGGHWRNCGMHYNGAIGFATLRRDGFAALRTKESGEMETKTLILTNRLLYVNFRGRSLRAEILDETGIARRTFSLVDCDKTRAMLGDVSDLAGLPLRIRFTLEQGEFYAFWTEPCP